MPDVWMLVMVGAGWLLVVVVVYALCVIASREDDRQEDATGRPQRPTVVADTGAIRARLARALAPLDADQLTVTVRIDARDAVLASARPLVEAAEGRWVEQAVPVRVGGRNVAAVHAYRRPGGPRFRAEDMFALQEVAADVAASMQAAHPSGSVPVDAPSAMA